MAISNNTTILLENCRIGFLNFNGVEGKFNAKGKRNFCIFLEPDVAEQMQKDGWTGVKHLNPRDEQEDRQAYIQVAVNFGSRPPKVFMVTSKNKTALTEDLVGILDFADIDYADIILNAFPWEVQGNSGVKAYLKEAYVKIHESVLDMKYIDVPDSARSGLEDLGEIQDMGELDYEERRALEA